ncbi:unnamed protein product [Didymodactylos carnosus]|uniref:Uncharacterized protein n=1 Tax=Didymodactylos carnosus TaxID=1234261 RepID=A0A8S3AD84_9BILA|nr:unnamed protein product [Didymodactylos carnosus]
MIVLWGLLDRDDTIKKICGEQIDRQKELEQQLNNEQALNYDLQEKYEKACEKRDAIKHDMHNLQQQLDKAKADYK